VSGARPPDEGRADASDEHGERLMAQAGWLALLLRHLAGRAVRARVELDDLVQETLLRVCAMSSPLPEREPGELALRRLLATVARHAVTDVARRLRSARRSGQETRLLRADWSGTGLSQSRLPGLAPGPATLVGMAEDQRALIAAFERLAPEHRRVIGLRQFEGLDAAETGRRMGRSATAVHSLYRRALAAWHEALA